MTTFVLALALQCIFPIFESAIGQFVGMSIVNTDTQTHDYVLTARNSEGSVAQEARMTLKGGNQRAFLLSEVFSPTPGDTGWIQVDSAAPGCFSYLSAADSGSMLTGADAAAATATALLAPHIEVNTGFTELNYIDTSVIIVNPGVAVADVNLQLYGLDGLSKATVQVSVPARGSRVVQMSRIFESAMPANTLGGRTFSGYLRLSSASGVAAWQRIDGVLARSLLRAKSAEELKSTTDAWIPHFAVGGTYGSILNVINPGATALNLELIAFDDRGVTLGEPARITLSPREVLRAPVDAFFRFVTPAIFPPLLISGSIRIRELGDRNFQIAGDVEIFDRGLGGRDSSMLYPISDTAATSWVLPFAASFNPYFTGYAIQNPNSLLTVQTDVTVEFIGSNGAVLDRKAIQLSPRTRAASLVTGPNASGYLRITSNFPVHVFGTIGTTNHRMLDQIPALR